MSWDMPVTDIGEESFYELPSWEVIHFMWMIAWRPPKKEGRFCSTHLVSCLRASNTFGGEDCNIPN